MGMYPPEWWWAERQVSEVLAENPGELVKTGTTGTFKVFNADSALKTCALQRVSICTHFCLVNTLH